MTSRSTLLAAGLMTIPLLMMAPRAQAADAPDQTTTKPAEEVVVVKGKHVTVKFPESDLKILNDRNAFMGFLDSAYGAMEELTDHSPEVIIRVGKLGPGAWGVASADGVTISPGGFTSVIKQFNNHLIEFGTIHEMGHVFDARNKPRWYITPHNGGEEFANLKLNFALERLLTPDQPYRIKFGPGKSETGVQLADRVFGGAAAKYLNDPSKDWTAMSSDQLHSFHLGIVRKYGWDVLKKWFRVYPIMEANGFWAPKKTDDPERMIVECAIFTHFTGADLMPYFQKYRLPVTPEAMEAAVKKYKLDEAFEKVEKQFKADVAAKKILSAPTGLKTE